MKTHNIERNVSLQGEISIHLNGKWKRKYFVLKDTTLFYYKNNKAYQDDKRKVPQGLIKLSLATPVTVIQTGTNQSVVVEEHNKFVQKEIFVKKSFAFFIGHQKGNEKLPPNYILASSTLKERSDWLKTIHYNINSSTLSFLENNHTPSPILHHKDNPNHHNNNNYNGNDDYGDNYNNNLNNFNSHFGSPEKFLERGSHQILHRHTNTISIPTKGRSNTQYEMIMGDFSPPLRNPSFTITSRNLPSYEYSIRDIKLKDVRLNKENIDVEIRNLVKNRVNEINIYGKESSPNDRFNWEINFKEIVILSKIGEGGFGEVLKGVWRKTHVAVKQLNNSEISRDDIESFVREISLLSQLRHPNILLFLGASIDYPSVFYITEFVPKGNLRQVLTGEKLDWNTKLMMAMDTARGVNYLHSIDPPILHRDLKSLNLLVDQRYSIRVADFGLFKLKDMQKANTKMGTVNYVAPEILKETGPYTEKADVFSFALVLWEILTEKLPYGDLQVLQIVRAIDLGKRPEIPLDCDKNYQDLIQRCWDENPDVRPPFDEIYDILENILHYNLDLEQQQIFEKEKEREVNDTVKNWFSGENPPSCTPSRKSNVSPTIYSQNEDGLTKNKYTFDV